MKDTETELRFLVHGTDWKNLGKSHEIWQAYISSDYRHVVRIRTKEEQGYLTIKGEKIGETNFEKEYQIPAEDVIGMIKQPNLIEGHAIHKIRHVIKSANLEWEGQSLIWEVDEFLDANSPLVIAEIELIGPETAEELDQLKEAILKQLPPWIGMRLDFMKDTSLSRYFGNELAMRPFTEWSPTEKEEVIRHVMP